MIKPGQPSTLRRRSSRREEAITQQEPQCLPEGNLNQSCCKMREEGRLLRGVLVRPRGTLGNPFATSTMRFIIFPNWLSLRSRLCRSRPKTESGSVVPMGCRHRPLSALESAASLPRALNLAMPSTDWGSTCPWHQESELIFPPKTRKVQLVFDQAGVLEGATCSKLIRKVIHLDCP